MEKRSMNVQKLNNAEIQKVLRFIEFMDVVNEMDDLPFFSLTDCDDEIHKMYNEFLDPEGNFQYDVFFKEIHTVLGPNFKNIIIGYKAMVETFCKPDSELLEFSDTIIIPEEDEMIVKAEEVCEFSTFQTWVNKASSWIGGFSPNEKLICMDKNGNVLTCGEDFQHARDTNAFPIKAYRLKRNTEDKITKSIHNN